MHKRLKVFTWHIHGSYLYYLSLGNFDIYIPLDKTRGDGYGGRGNFAFGPNVIEVPANEVNQLELDCILFQSLRNYLVDQYELFSNEQHTLPKIYLEHDPPRNTPTDTDHPVNDPNITLVHVTHFNELMWNNNHTPTIVIDHGVTVPPVEYKGDLEKGIVVINNIARRGRRLGLDIFLEARKHIPLDIVGMGSKEVEGIGEVPLALLPEFISHYRFFFNPIRYTSLGLAVCEAMMLGMPILGMATTEMPTVIHNGVSGYVDTNVHNLIGKMKMLLQDQELARRMGEEARKTAMQRFSISRFTQDWERLFALVTTAKQPDRLRMSNQSI